MSLQVSSPRPWFPLMVLALGLAGAGVFFGAHNTFPLKDKSVEGKDLAQLRSLTPKLRDLMLNLPEVTHVNATGWAMLFRPTSFIGWF